MGLLTIACNLALSTYNAKAQLAPVQSLKQGDKVPEFSLKDQNGKTFNLADVVGKRKLILFFYPKDESPVCTAEACAFRDDYEKFKEADAIIIGINNGTSESHKAFATKNNLPFVLLSDPDNRVLNQFGVKEELFKDNLKVSGRETFVIGLDGKIVYHFRDFMNGAEHATQVLNYLSSK